MPSPVELGLHQDGVDAGEVCMGEDLGVGNLFLPRDAENPSKAGGVEVVQLPCMPLVDYPCFTAVEKVVRYTMILVLAVMPLRFQTFLLSLPKAALALASLAFSSSSMMTDLARVLPR